MIEGSLDNFIRGVRESDIARIQEAWFKLEKEEKFKVREVLTQIPENELKILEKKIKVFNYHLWNDIFVFDKSNNKKSTENIIDKMPEPTTSISVDDILENFRSIQAAYQKYYEEYVKNKVYILKYYKEILKSNNFNDDQIETMIIEEAKIIKPLDIFQK